MAPVFMECVGYPSVAVVKCHGQKHLKSLLRLMVLSRQLGVRAGREGMAAAAVGSWETTSLPQGGGAINSPGPPPPPQ